MLLGVDVGGTFTDAVLLDGGEVHAAKVPTTPRQESVGVMRAVEAVLARAGASSGDVEVFAHAAAQVKKATSVVRNAPRAVTAGASSSSSLSGTSVHSPIARNDSATA